MKLYFIILLLFVSFTASKSVEKIIFTTTSNQVTAILSEFCGNYAEITTLTPPGVSPHTYSPKPSQILKIQQSKALFYISENLDGWAANLTNGKKIELLSILPENLKLSYDEKHSHDHSHHKESHFESNNIDPHFWTDPIAVKMMIDPLLKEIISLDPKNALVYKENSNKFINKLDSLHDQIKDMMRNLKGEPVFLFHPSFRYFLKRYGLIYKGSIEISPGKQPSAQYTIQLIKKIKNNKAKALFTEPQLPDKPAKTIAEAANIDIYILDPVGGSAGLNTYEDLIMYNAKIFREALK